jgi:hypothetical protein
VSGAERTVNVCDSHGLGPASSPPWVPGDAPGGPNQFFPIFKVIGEAP